MYKKKNSILLFKNIYCCISSSATHTSSIQKASTHNTTILNVSIALLLAYSVHICTFVIQCIVSSMLVFNSKHSL